jgi:hypothetical protein
MLWRARHVARRAECEDVVCCEGEAGGEAKREGGRGARRGGGQSAGRSIVGVVEVAIVIMVVVCAPAAAGR